METAFCGLVSVSIRRNDMKRWINGHFAVVGFGLSLMIGTVLIIGDGALAHDEIFLGHNAAGKLIADSHQHNPIRMPVSNLPGFRGWAAGGPGIESLAVSDPKEDFFALPDTAQIQIVLFSIDPTLHLFNSDGSGFVPEGGTYVVLSPFFHWHCFWNLSEGEYGTVYEAQLQFFDQSGQFTPSDPVLIDFIPQCPGDVDLSTVVNVVDLLAVINSWGECPGGCGGSCHADFNQTCTVDVSDLLTVINNWGVCVPPG
jgi:hypothetical protein